MKVEYDNDANALYVTVREGLVCRSEQIDAGTLIDVDEHGSVVGVEIIKPDRNWLTGELRGRLSPTEIAALEPLEDTRWAWERGIELSGV